MVKVKVPNIVRGGKAIPIKGKTNYYYMVGRKHSNGGIDIGENPRTGLEVEDGEVMHIGKNEVKVFSSVPFLNGESPAEKVMEGDNPTDVFNAQERFKKRNKINDDGTRKKGEWGMKEGSTADVITDMIPIVGTLKEATRLVRNPSWEQAGWTLASLASDVTGGLVGKALVKSARAARAARAAGKRARVIHPNVAKGLGIATTSTGDYAINNIQSDISKKRKRMGGLSRNKDYGSKSKPYPKVKSGDFAGGGRSYPIPTKTDAIDALRLAGLHGRSDVKAEVYRKYPELRKKSKAGGLYSVTVDGKTKLYQFPSTGESSARSAEVRIRKVGGGPKGINPDLYNEEDNKDNWWRRTTNKIGEYIKDNPSIISDTIGLTSNTVGGLLSHKWNRDMLNKLKYSDQPIARSATKLKTRININPQLDKMRESLASYERAIDANTGSSQVALSRKQRARLANMLTTNELYGNKENIETELINKDRLNQQSVAHANIADYNRWAESRAAFKNAILEKKAENDVALAETLNAGVQDLIGRREKRKSENQTIAAMALANPNLPIEMLYAQGLVNKKTYEAYKKAYRNKKKND